MREVKRRQRRKDARPQEILQAAIELFAEKGFAGTQIAEIAQRAGVAKGTVYLYYETKGKLFEGIVRSNITPVMDRIKEMLEGHSLGAAALLRAVFTVIYLEFVGSPARRAVIRVLIAEGRQFPDLIETYHREVLQFAERLLRTVMELGRKSGEFRECPALHEPRVVIGPAILALVWRLTFDPVDPLDTGPFLEAHLDLVLHGLLKRPAVRT